MKNHSNVTFLCKTCNADLGGILAEAILNARGPLSVLLQNVVILDELIDLEDRMDDGSLVPKGHYHTIFLVVPDKYDGMLVEPFSSQAVEAYISALYRYVPRDKIPTNVIIESSSTIQEWNMERKSRGLQALGFRRAILSA